MKLSKRIVACLLCLVMVVGLFPAATLAADNTANTSINFLDPASADKFTVVNQSQTKIVENEGLYFITTRPAMEPCNGRNSGDQATTPEDLVTIPVTGDEWTATIKFKFSTNGAANGYYQFFGFYAAEGDDYQNMAGIRGGDGALQDFLRVGGEITADTDGVKSSPGLANETTYWFQIEKKGTTYTCNRSSDGLTFTKMFDYEDTGINADNLIIDAYTGMTTGYVCMVEYLAFGDVVSYELNNAVDTVLNKIPVAPEKIPTKKADDTFKLPKAPSGTTVTYTAEPNCIVDGKLVGTGATDTKVKLTVVITAAGQTVTKVLDVIVPAKGAGTADPTVYTVTFNPNVSGMSAVEVKVEDGDTVEVPDTLKRVGYSATWRSGNTAFDFNTPITQNITLTASWTKDWNQMYSLAEEYADYFPFGTFGTLSPGSGQTEREYCTYSGNNGKMTYNFDANGSRNTYNSTVNSINADSSLTQAEKDAKILEAEGKVQVNLNSGLVSALRSIQNWNNAHPEGPKKYFRQHVIAWHGSEQNQAFYHLGFDTSKGWATPQIMNARLDSYIENYFKLCEPYKDVILSWDIVNEALDCYTGMVRNHDDSGSQQSEWGHIYRYYKDGKAVGLDVSEEELDERLYVESEWIRVAFASARKWAKEIGADWKLYYNDYHDSNKLYEPKLSNTIKVLKPIYEAGNIDGYGLQARVAYANPSADFIREHIEMGLTVANEFSFSEADFRSDFEINPNYDPDQPTRRVTSADGDTDWNAGGSGRYSQISQLGGNTYDVWNSPVRRKANFNNSNIDEETKRLQADYVADIMDHVLELRDKCGAIAIDGTNDSSTFNSNKGCHLWDASGNEKPSFYAAVGAPNRLKMREAIAAGPDASEKAKYTAASWTRYETAKAAAEALVDVRIYDSNGVENVKAATAELNAAIEGLTASGDACKHEKTEVRGAVEATSTKDGYTGDTYCTVCGEKLEDGTVIPALGFVDVTPDRYYYNAVMWAAKNDITTGVDDTHFAPNADCTRAQAVMFLWNAAGCPEVEENVTNPFTDVTEGRYYYKAVLWAISNNITDGTDATHFSPNKKLDRATFVTFLWRAKGEEKVDATDKFTDVKPGKFYATAVAWAVANGITEGKTDTTFAPTALCTRAQVVTFLQRAYGK